MSSPARSRHSEDGSLSSAMTWLQAAEHVLREEGPDMHIRELTSRIMELGMVKSSCATSLETLLYRQTSSSNTVSKFTRVNGKHGWFGLKEEYMVPSPLPVPSVPKKVNGMDSSVKVENNLVYNEDSVKNEVEKETKTAETVPSVNAMLESLYG